MASGDDQLLREYALTRSESAFAELAARHVNWVYSAATRMLGDSHTAQDVTQTVFLLLAQQPRKALDKPLSSWLFQVLRYSIANARRAQGRRQKYEREAAAMASKSPDQDADQLWDGLAPQLDELMARLRWGHREVLLLRFYQSKSMAEIGQSLNITEEAARKRVSSAVEQLRRMFRGRGVVAPAAAIGAVLLARTTQAAPPAVAGAVASLSRSPSPSILALANAVRRMILMSKLKIAGLFVMIAAIVPAAATIAVVRPWDQPPAPAPAQATYAVPFKIGDVNFLSGDNLTITEIHGDSSTFAPGNTYTVSGTYTLASHPSAILALYTTGMYPGQNDNGPYGNNQTTIQAGKGTFTLNLTMRVEGYPHVSLYPADGGNSFGSLYFGTGKYIYNAAAH